MSICFKHYWNPHSWVYCADAIVVISSCLLKKVHYGSSKIKTNLCSFLFTLYPKYH
jgi:hypothetical protein